MTRVTNFGRKRTYLEAGFGPVDVGEEEQDSRVNVDSKPKGEEETMTKKHKRRRKKTKLAARDEEGVDANGGGSITGRDNKGTIKKAETGEKRRRKDQQAKGKRNLAHL